MPTLNPDTLYFCLEYNVINLETKTLHWLGYLALWDDNAKRYSNPEPDLVSPRKLLVRYHIGNKVTVEPDGGLSWSDEDVISPCEHMLKDNGYTVVPI